MVSEGMWAGPPRAEFPASPCACGRSTTRYVVAELVPQGRSIRLGAVMQPQCKVCWCDRTIAKLDGHPQAAVWTRYRRMLARGATHEAPEPQHGVAQ